MIKIYVMRGGIWRKVVETRRWGWYDWVVAVMLLTLAGILYCQLGK